MNSEAPALSSRNLALAAVAALGLGLLGGVAAHPVMKPPQGSDWRERYRAAAARPVDDGPDFGASYAPAHGYGYDYGWAGRLVDAGAERFAEAVPDMPAVDGEDDFVAGPEPDLSALDSRSAAAPSLAPADGRAVVADALARTAGSFDEPPAQADSDEAMPVTTDAGEGGSDSAVPPMPVRADSLQYRRGCPAGSEC